MLSETKQAKLADWLFNEQIVKDMFKQSFDLNFKMRERDNFLFCFYNILKYKKSNIKIDWQINIESARKPEQRPSFYVLRASKRDKNMKNLNAHVFLTSRQRLLVTAIFFQTARHNLIFS